MVFAEATTRPFKLLFSSQHDLIDPWGKLHISVTPAETIRKIVRQSEMSRRAAEGKPGRSLIACFPRADGSWEGFSQDFKLTEPGPNWYNHGKNTSSTTVGKPNRRTAKRFMPAES